MGESQDGSLPFNAPHFRSPHQLTSSEPCLSSPCLNWDSPLCRHPWVSPWHRGWHGTRLPCLRMEVPKLHWDLEGGPRIRYLGEEEERCWSWKRILNQFVAHCYFARVCNQNFEEQKKVN